ncbi:Methyltransferase domain containing protein [uncultured Caudovirales phage]|uniref:Methyltransferase domain containing protein n=1 Tax=uncultured Caudovirales phage TaxID=2100421 RepID=A0A6J5NM63_9CAUD|nr:Methyltransferase domain containing protein [uncultured Caudovirales phage]
MHSDEIKYPNWFFSGGTYNFYTYLNKYKDKPGLRFLQIGAFTGDASKWLLENILTDTSSTLTDVDTWTGSDEKIHKKFDWNHVEKTYDDKMSKFVNVIKEKQTSKQFLENNNAEYDFIYIDGDHMAKQVYLDAVLSWKALKNNGILAFDDYEWTHDSEDPEKSPGLGIDKFLEEEYGSFILLKKSNQLWIKKI